MDGGGASDEAEDEVVADEDGELRSERKKKWLLCAMLAWLKRAALAGSRAVVVTIDLISSSSRSVPVEIGGLLSE